MICLFFQVLGLKFVSATVDLNGPITITNVTQNWKISFAVTILTFGFAIFLNEYSFMIALIITYISFFLYFFIQYLLFPLCYNSGKFIQRRSDAFRKIGSENNGNNTFETLLQIEFLVVMISCMLSVCFDSPFFLKYLLFVQAISFLLLVADLIYMMLFILFRLSFVLETDMEKMKLKDKPHYRKINEILLRRYFQQHLLGYALISPCFLLGKIIYSLKLVSLRTTIDFYQDQGLELALFSLQFLFPMMWQLLFSIQTHRQQSVGSIRCLEYRPVLLCILTTSTYLNFKAVGTTCRFFGLVISVSTLLQALGAYNDLFFLL